jgi:integrase/recombinase XerD
MEIQTAIEHCIDDLGTAPNTAKAYRMGLNAFTAYLKTQSIETSQDVDALRIEHFIYFLPYLSKRYKKQTSSLYGVAAKALLDWLVIADLVHLTYQETVRFQSATKKSHRRREDKLPRWPGRDDITKALSAVRLYEANSPRKERNIALIEWLASTGCRISEATALNVQDVDMTTNSVVVTGKGSKERRVFLCQSAIDALMEYWKARGSSMPTDPVFWAHDKGVNGRDTRRMTPTTARRVVKAVANLAGIDPNKFSPHYFRHAFAIRVLSETGNLAMVQDLMGHKDSNSTRVYAKIYPEDLQKAHKKIFG